MPGDSKSGSDKPRDPLSAALKDLSQDVESLVGSVLHRRRPPAPKVDDGGDMPWDAVDIELRDNPPGSTEIVGAVQCDITAAAARPFGLRHDERGIFEQGWSLLERVARGHDPDGTSHAKAIKALHDRGEAAVQQALPTLKALIAGEPSSLPGLQIARRLPVGGRGYVIFSDHHFVHTGHRTNFFGDRGHVASYADALNRYYDAGFHVIENGDVEDLIFFDPAFHPEEARRRVDMSFDALQARRKQVRLEQLSQILDDALNAPLVAAAQRLAADGRLHRTTGNHDYDEQTEPFLSVLQGVYPGLQQPADVLLLDDPDGTVQYAVMHGHQLDPTTNTVVAPYLGETISETIGLYTQGPDRTWRWAADGVRDWALGHKPFLNDLVVEPPKVGSLLLEVADILEGVASTRSDRALTLQELVRDGRLDGWLDEIIDVLAGKDIGWDYFIHRDPLAAVLAEVLTGDRFFKFRLLDEDGIRTQLGQVFGADAPVLVLGHSHEVRFQARSPTTGKPFAGYINTATAGRFENLMWAVEIVDGQATLVSWSRESLPDGPVQRRVWTPGELDGHGIAYAARQASPVPVIRG